MAFSPSSRAGARLRVVVGLAAAVVLLAGLATVIARSPGSSNATTARAAAGTSTTTTTAPPPETTATTSAAAVSDEPAAIREIREQVAQIRGLEWKAPLKVAVLPSGEFVNQLRRVIERDRDRAKEARESETLKLLRVIPQDVDYASAIDDLLAGSVLGFYDTITKELFVRDVGGGALGPQARMTLAHELDHALTDQHFGFGERIDALDDAGRTEESNAFLGLIEGDASLVNMLWADRYLSEDEQIEAFFGEVDSPSGGKPVPGFMRDLLNFPYQDGTKFVEQLFDQGGFAKVDEAYARPPTSTEQILHPALYAAGQGWRPPPLPDMAVATGCAPVHAGTIGEFEMTLVLDDQIEGEVAERAAEGWNGDAFEVVRCGGAAGLVDRWQADNEADAAEYASALGEWAQGWAEAGAGPGPDGRFAGRAGAGRIVHRGTAVDLVLAADQATADRISAAVG